METTTRGGSEKSPACHNCGTDLTVVFKPRPVVLWGGKFTWVMPEFECAACGERIAVSSLSPEHDVHLPGPLIHANY
jgi:hypothetical protein